MIGLDTSGRDPGIDGDGVENISHAARVRWIAAQLTIAEPDVVAVIEYIVTRLAMGREQYGDLVIASDTRDFKLERKAEHADAVVYHAIDQIRRINAERAPRDIGIYFPPAEPRAPLPEMTVAAMVLGFDVSDVDGEGEG